MPNNFTVSSKAFFEGNDTNPAGFSAENSWMGGFRCSNASHQFGGFGGGGAGCKGGGGGGGFVGKCSCDFHWPI